jgi:hypothetical protein
MEVMPDTVDLAQSASMALNAITRCTDSGNDYSLYFHGNITQNPIRLAGNAPDNVAQWKLTEPLILLRLMSGNLANLDVDRAWLTGLSELPDRIPKTHPVYIGRGLVAISVMYGLTNDARWRDLGIRIVDRLSQFCGKHEDFAYFPVITTFLADPTSTVPLDEYQEPFPTGWPAMHDAWLVQGLVTFYEQTAYRPALDLADKLAKHMRCHGKIFSKDGEFCAGHNGHLGPKSAVHFHRHSNVLLALLAHARATGDMEYARLAQRGYEYGKKQGNATIGFFPEYIREQFPDDRNGMIDCEGCCVADMTLLALNLSLCGVGDYWEDVDRYTRNMLTQMQLKDAAEITQEVRELPASPVDKDSEESFQAAERLVGAFAGWSGPNEFRVCGPGVMQCCTANCGRALYFVWDRMLVEMDDAVQLNLLLNRVSKDVVVRSFLPYEGRVEVVLKKAAPLKIRLPQWLERDSLQVVDSNGHSLDYSIQDTFLLLEFLPAQELVRLQFDLPEREVIETVGHVDASIRFRGNEVIHFSPPGKRVAYWHDKDVGPGTCPETVRTYFVPDKRHEDIQVQIDAPESPR